MGPLEGEVFAGHCNVNLLLRAEGGSVVCCALYLGAVVCLVSLRWMEEERDPVGLLWIALCFSLCAACVLLLTYHIAVAWSGRDRRAYPRAFLPYKSVPSRYD